ncbi:MAG: VCBS repeat-containing protein [Deltaproteobacteria bacterium]|nr:VCBS repeat-containing protein [Deltaproteobacteria bacterium]
MRRLLTWVFVFGMACSVESELGSNVRCADGGVACVASEPRLCIDVQSDPRHCGACANACPAGSGCVAGRCCGSPACGGRCLGTRWELREAVAGRETIEVFALDIDADGRADLLTADQLDSTMHVFWGNPGGSLASPSVWPMGRMNGQIAWGDLDEDGDLDLVATVQSHGPPFADAIGIMRREPGRSVPSLRLIPEVGDVREIALLDADLDGHLDVLVRRVEGGCLLLRRGDGRGGIEEQGRCVTMLRDLPDMSIQLTRVAVAGGRQGLVVRYPNDFELMRFGAGGDVFDSLPILPGVRDATNLMLMDNNGDGRGEWQVHRRLPPDGAIGTDVYRWDGAQVVAAGCSVTGVPEFLPRAIADFDGDGMLDLAGYHRVSDGPWMLRMYLRR